MKRLTLTLSLMFLVLASSGCGLRNRFLRGGPCALRRPAAAPFARYLPGQPTVPVMAMPEVPGCGVSAYDPAIGYESGIMTDGAYIEGTPIESVPFEASGISEIPSGAQRPTIILPPVNRGASVGRSRPSRIVDGPEMAGLPGK